MMIAVSTADHGQRHQCQHGDQPGGLFLGLELALQLPEVAFRHRLPVDLGANVGDDTAHVGTVGVGRDDDTPARVFSTDLIGAVAILDAGNVRERYPAGRRLDEQILETALVAGVVRQAQGEVETSIAFHDLADSFSRQQLLQPLQQIAGGESVARGSVIIDADLVLRDQHLLFDLKISEPA
jgi:hypothetical protein